jgi:hypothetical protein
MKANTIMTKGIATGSLVIIEAEMIIVKMDIRRMETEDLVE